MAADALFTIMPSCPPIAPPTQCLQDHTQRPTARQALHHPWLQGPGTSERGKGKKLAFGVVRRIQVCVIEVGWGWAHWLPRLPARPLPPVGYAHCISSSHPSFRLTDLLFFSSYLVCYP